MASFYLKTVAVLAVLQSTCDASPKALSMKTYRRPRANLQKRGSLSVTLGNAFADGLYYVNASVGTPPQEVQLQIDTGSSDVWMFGPNSCDTSTSICAGGVFDYTQSSTSSVIDAGAFSIQYFTPGSGVKGDYIADVFSIGGTTLTNMTMAVATSASSVSTGIMGIGFDTDESILVSGNAAKPYPNIIDVMVSENIINTRAYSLYLDNLEDSTGTVLFGGYDTEKYSGDLAVLEIFPDSQTGTISSFTVAWTSLSLTDSSGSTALSTSTSGSFPLPGILDSGTTETLVPSDLYDELATYFGATNDATYGTLVYCEIGNGTLDFGFGGSAGTTISVGFAELAIPLFDENGNPLLFSDGNEACSFGLTAAGQGEPFLLGDTFLRSAYVIYDLDNQQVGLAQTVFESTKSNIVEIGASGNVAGVISVASAVTVKQTATAKAGNQVQSKGSGSVAQATATAHTGAITGVKTTVAVKTGGSATTTNSAPAATHKNTAPTLGPVLNLMGGVLAAAMLL